MTPAEAVQAAAGVEAEVRYRLQFAREAYEAGRLAGLQQAKAAGDARWSQAPRARVADGPSHDELEARRWGPGGREHAADPRPGDFPGREGRVLRYADTQRVTEIWSVPRPDPGLAGSSHRPVPEQDMEATA